MYKTELIKRVAKKAKVSERLAAAVLNTCMQEIAGGLARKKDIHLVGFGSFTTRRRAESGGRNFRTGERVIVPERRIPVFHPGAVLRRAARKVV